MAEVLRPEDNVNLCTYPGPSVVKLKADAVIELGKMVVSVAGYGVSAPAAGNKNTAQMRGIALSSEDNTGGADGAKTVVARPGCFRFKNSETNPVTQANVDGTVYAADGETISSSSDDGPPAGMLTEFNSADTMGLPCKVALKCFP